MMKSAMDFMSENICLELRDNSFSLNGGLTLKTQWKFSGGPSRRRIQLLSMDETAIPEFKIQQMVAFSVGCSLRRTIQKEMRWFMNINVKILSAYRRLVLTNGIAQNDPQT